MKDRLPRTQELQFLMEQIELIHNIDKIEKKRKKKRERQEQKLKEIAPPAKKSKVPLDSESRLSKEEDNPMEEIPSEHKELEAEQEMEFEFERKETQKEHETTQKTYDQLWLEELERLAALQKEQLEQLQK